MKFRREFLSHLTTEWNPTFSKGLLVFHETWFFLAFLILASIIFLLKRPWRVFPSLLTVALLWLGFSANRFIPGVVMSLSLVAVYGSWNFKWNGRWIMTTAGALALLAVLSGRYWSAGLPFKFGTGVDPRVFPTQTVAALKSLKLSGGVWNSFYYGCYLAWQLEEQRPIIVHGFVTDISIFQRFYSGIGIDRAHFDQAVTPLGLGAFLLERNENSRSLVAILLQHPGWQLLSQDEASVLFVRKASFQ